MPEPLVRRINLDLLYLPFVEKLLATLAACQAKGVHYHATIGTRTIEEQDRLYAQGRTVPGKKVTNARGGQSLHNYGLACDVVRDLDLAKVGLQPDWDKAGYESLYYAAQENGLETGFFWKFSDPGHIQIPRPEGYLSDGEWCAALQAIEAEGGIKGVWAHLDSVL